MLTRVGFKVLGILAAAFVPFCLMADGGPGGHGKSGSGFRVSPDVINFTATGSVTTLTRTVSVHQPGPSGTGGAFTASAKVTATTPPVNWLAVAPASGAADATLTLTATPGALPAGLYAGTVTVTPAAAGATPAVVNVTLRILTGSSGAPAVFVRPMALHFKMASGGANPEPKPLSVSSPTGGSSFTWTASSSVTTPAGGTWLPAPNPASGSGPGAINVSVVGTGLAVGEYSGAIKVTSGSVISTIPVTLEVTSPGSSQTGLVIAPRALNFIVLPGAAAPGPEVVHIRQVPPATPAWTAATTAPCSWLKLNNAASASGSGVGSISASVDATGAAHGSQECDVKVTAGVSSDTVRVFLRVVGAPSGNPGKGPSPDHSAVRISPRVAQFTSNNGVVSPASVAVQIVSQTTGLSFTASATTPGANWLHLSAASGSIPATINLSVSPAGLNPGTYSGLVSLAISGSVQEQRTIPVVLRVVAAGANTPMLSLHPAAVTFQAAAAASNPGKAEVDVEAVGAATIPFQTGTTTQGGGNWLSVTPATGTAPQEVQVGVNLAGLAQGAYSGSIVFQPQSGTTALPATLTVLLTVTAASGTTPVSNKVGGSRAASEGPGVTGVFLQPAAEFSGVENSPMAVQVQVFGPDGLPLDGATVSVTPSDDSGSIALENAGGGMYSGVFQSLSGGPIALTAQVNAPSGQAMFAIGGDLDGSDQPTPVIYQGGVVSAANYLGGAPQAPGAVATIFGVHLAPSTALAESFPLPTELAGTSVLVGGIQAPLLAVVAGDGVTTSDQISFQLPFELSGFTYAEVVVNNNGALSAGQGLSIAPSVPGVFTLNQAGTGPAAALHADYSPVTATDPAQAGEIVLLYATGLGTVSPAVATGASAGAASPVTADYQVSVGGRQAAVSYAGIAPGWAGLYQLNVAIPKAVTAGDAALAVTVGGIPAGDGITLPVGGQGN